MLDIDKKGALEMGRKRFISAMLKTLPIKNMGEKGETYLNDLYNEFEATKRKSTRSKC